MDNNDLESIVRKFSTYNDYLDSMLTKDDMMFLQDKDMCRELLMLGYHSNKRIIPEEDFDRKKAEILKDVSEKRVKEIKLCGKGELCNEVLMQALAKREEDNLVGRVATIIFLRDTNPKGEEISSYIDYTHRLMTENWEDYFSGQKKMVPLPTDLRSNAHLVLVKKFVITPILKCEVHHIMLFNSSVRSVLEYGSIIWDHVYHNANYGIGKIQTSFYNWNKEESFFNSSPNFEVITDNDTLKLFFICKKDSKPVEVNPKVQRKDDEEDLYRHDLNVTDYLQAVLVDHIVDKPAP